MIEGYERKVSQLREESVGMKSRHKELQELFVGWREMVEKIGRYFGCQMMGSRNGLGYEGGNKQMVSKITS
jgi:hypothetical protein